MYTTVLIIVLGFFTSQSGGTTVQVPFQKMEYCIAAKSQIESQITKSARMPAMIISSGCYEQGRIQ